MSSPGTTPGTGGSGSGGSTSGSGGSASGSGGSGGTDGGTDAPAMTPGCQAPVDPDKPYDKLSQTGCMDPKDVTKMASRVFAYEVNAPLWSDGAAKTRGIALPPGGKIHVKNCAGLSASSLKMGDECCTVDPNNYPNCLPPADDGRWVMPTGTVAVKNFLFDNKLVETRLFVRQSDTKWIGYSYQWNEAQTDATIVGPDRLSVMFNTGMRQVAWNYPSRKDCMTCHNENVGYYIGTETRQLNRSVVTPMTNQMKNQIDSMAAAGMFENAPAAPYTAALVTPYAIPGQIAGPPATATVEDRALSYLHANCSYCHRPDAQIFYSMDLRRDVALQNRGICDADPMKGNFGIDGAKLLVPATPDKSIMSIRMKSLDPMQRMPQLGTVVVDQSGLDLITQWITTTVKTCPM